MTSTNQNAEFFNFVVVVFGGRISTIVWLQTKPRLFHDRGNTTRGEFIYAWKAEENLSMHGAEDYYFVFPLLKNLHIIQYLQKGRAMNR